MKDFNNIELVPSHSKKIFAISELWNKSYSFWENNLAVTSKRRIKKRVGYFITNKIPCKYLFIYEPFENSWFLFALTK